MGTIMSTDATAVGRTPATTTAVTIGYLHDVVRQTSLLREALQSDKTRIGCFLGAGCPLGVFDNDELTSLGLIPDVAGLTSAVAEALKALDKKAKVDPTRQSAWEKLVKECTRAEGEIPNVEHILSELRTLTGRRGNSPVNELPKECLIGLDADICNIIADKVGVSLPTHVCSYNRFAAWAGGIQRMVPLEIFTPNYDLLVEEAFERLGIPLFDGFVGSREPFFDIASIEQDAIPPRWNRLWKLHGSINWQKRDDGGVFRVSQKAAPGKAMIYPSHLKYDQSRRMPYLAMIDRLRAFFRPVKADGRGLGPPILVISGYSFSDDHINEVILDGLRGNATGHCFVLAYEALEKLSRVRSLATEQRNMTVISRDGAIVGGRIGKYTSVKVGDEHRPWLVEEDVKVNPSEKAPEIRCLLGDFHYFAKFVELIRGGVGDAFN